MIRLRDLVRAQLGAPLVVLYSWSDGSGDPPLVAIPERLRAQGLDLVRVNGITESFPASRLLIPHNGHPTAFQDRLLAAELKRRLVSDTSAR